MLNHIVVPETFKSRLVDVMRLHPNIRWGGIVANGQGVGWLNKERVPGLDEEDFMEAWTAYLFLCHFGKLRARVVKDGTSYGLKHSVEAWAAAMGLRQYVNQGCFCAGALYLYGAALKYEACSSLGSREPHNVYLSLVLDSSALSRAKEALSR